MIFVCSVRVTQTNVNLQYTPICDYTWQIAYTSIINYTWQIHSHLQLHLASTIPSATKLGKYTPIYNRLGKFTKVHIKMPHYKHITAD